MTKEINEFFKQRLEKLKILREKNIDPYQNIFKPDNLIENIINNFLDFEKSDVKVAGRITTIRTHGKATFADLKDSTGKIQIYLRKDILGDEKYELIELLDIGDFVGIIGEVFKTRTGEITILVKDFTLLSKSLHPLPEKWHGLKDVEIRYRQRYLDLISNENVKEIFLKRTKIIKLFRKFLDDRGFLELETPMLQPLFGGATAKPFITYHNALNINLYLRIAPELYLKRVIVGGFEKVYEINRNFRNEGVSTLHNPEFTMIEIYQSYCNYEDVMRFTEELINYVVYGISGSLEIEYQNKKINFSLPYQRLSYIDAIRKYAGVDFNNLDFERAKDEAKRIGIETKEFLNIWSLADEIFNKRVEENLIQPTFVYDFPTYLSPLAKKKKDNENFVERFELFISGIEIANAFSELNDPIEQRERFEEQLKEGRGDVPKNIDEDFLLALEYGMPPCGGLGVGIDRLVMILVNSSSIREVLLFPLLKGGINQ